MSKANVLDNNREGLAVSVLGRILGILTLINLLSEQILNIKCDWSQGNSPVGWSLLDED